MLAPLAIRGAEFGDRLAKLSTSAQIGTGANVMLSGSVVGDAASQTPMREFASAATIHAKAASKLRGCSAHGESTPGAEPVHDHAVRCIVI